MPGYYGYYNPLESINTIMLVCFILSLISAIVLLAAFLPKSKQNRYSGFTKSVYNFLNFQSFWISPIIKLMYMTLAFTLVLSGLIILFILPLYGLILLVAGILIRLFFETGYILYAILDQLKILNGKSTVPKPFAAAPPICPNCGKPANAGESFCNGCGTKI
ncbi:MAG: zinc ribbon domain-containing protein [Christensenellales bacterium]